MLLIDRPLVVGGVSSCACYTDIEPLSINVLYLVQVQDEVKEFQHILEAEAEEERRQAEHQLKLVARSNEADVQEVQL